MTQIEHIWPEDKGTVERRGPLFSARGELIDAYNRAASLPVPAKGMEQHQAGFLSPITPFSAKKTPYPTLDNRRTFEFKAQSCQTGSGDVYLAIQQNGKAKAAEPDALHQYILNPDGTVVRGDELHSGVAQRVEEDELELIRTAIDRVHTSIVRSIGDTNQALNDERRRALIAEDERKKRIRKRLGWSAGSVVVVGGLLAGGYLAWSEWIDKPGKADDAHRAEFDAGEHSIDGEGIEITNYAIAPIPTDEFADIPTFRNGDSLASPRVIELDVEGCKTVTVDTADGQSVKIGVTEYNPLEAYKVIAYESGDGLTICTTEKPSDTLETEDYKIAVQLTDSE